MDNLAILNISAISFLIFFYRNCDLLLHPRRNVRINELRDKITDCACHKHSRARSSTEQISNSNGTPGWWSVGIKTIKNSFRC